MKQTHVTRNEIIKKEQPAAESISPAAADCQRTGRTFYDVDTIVIFRGIPRN